MTRAPRGLRAAATTLILIALVTAASSVTDNGRSTGVDPSSRAAPEADTTPDRRPRESEPERAAEVADPVRIRIPSVGIDAEVVGVGLQDDGAMETPDFGLAGWYTEGPRPGASGPSVVVAHVDSTAGPDVFYRLKDLRPGAEIHIDRHDGSTATWVSGHSEQTDKDALPIDEIWPHTREPVLRLITCGGTFDRSTGHYRDNLIVYADPLF
jgi:sortase (surface protein transpeptidase)